MEIAISTDLPKSAGFENVELATREILSENGFGILTEIDVKATMKKKLDKDMNNYKILGACNPPRAHKILEVDPTLGILLPCNVIIYETEDVIKVAATRAYDLFSKLNDNPDVGNVAKDVESIFAKVISDIKMKFK